LAQHHQAFWQEASSDWVLHLRNLICPGGRNPLSVTIRERNQELRGFWMVAKAANDFAYLPTLGMGWVGDRKRQTITL
jgi:hypothetical protein